ncbi:hypothetical protein VPNG_06238 [Cytospora leucostoma]|uniref:Histone deacetylation protein Rxt3 n=1 Tax=Cytospora leucostoma TaxID=1230097 RepID=A0A423WYH4_9PEZI|nr:hypothetical protein VPNG_06238 [Cytospora leucostoma]
MDHRDSRQPGPQPPNLPFSRNAQSPLYTRQPLPPPTPSQASSTTAQAYAIERQQQQQTQQHSQPPPPSGSSAFSPETLPRRPSDPHFFSSRQYEPSTSLAPTNHSRHQSASSITPAPPMNRAMPPPGSPQQPGQGTGQVPGPGLQLGPGGAYGLPPPRPPPVSVGPPTAFPGGRELPALGSITRTGSTGSSMSISSMLGGLSQARDPSAPSYAPPTTSPAVSAPSYPSSMHASPRLTSNHPEYAPYRRPHTPEQHQRMYETRDPRDPRSTGGSPHGMHSTPEMQRYGTPRETYRHPPPPMGPVEHAREFQRMSAGPIPPPRPSSQPKSFPNAAPHSRPMDMGRPPHPEMFVRREELRPGSEYNPEYNPERPIVVKHEEDRLIQFLQQVSQLRLSIHQSAIGWWPFHHNSSLLTDDPAKMALLHLLSHTVMGTRRSLDLRDIDMNRKGRISPLPQAVQGAQPQIPGPPGEAGIKSEFGRMFSGIGSGVNDLKISNPVTSNPQVPFAGSGLGRRDDSDHTPQDMIIDPKGGRDSSARGKRRKPKDDEAKGDEESTGRSTPVGRAKRQKTHSHHHHQDPNARSAAAQPHPAVVIPPKTKRTISNKTVIDSIAHKPREHLGDFIYELDLKPARVQDPHTSRPPRQSYQSTPKPLPIDVIKGKEGSTLMVKVGKQHLTRAAREEITSRRAVWGTDVYTDDSDVLAACIHGGWIRGEWPEDVDVELLGLDEGIGADIKDAKGGKKGRGKEPSPPQKRDSDFLEAPPKTGPVQVPEGQDMHVMVLVMPKLEKYASTVRFGIKSREWGGKLGRDGQRSSHDGLSFMIQSIRFVTNGAGPQSRLRGRDRRERMRKAMQEVEISRVFEVRVVPNTGSGAMPPGQKKKAPGSDGDKENRSVDRAERGSENHAATPQQQRSRIKEINAETPSANGGQAGESDQHNRDDDSGVGDVGVSGAGDDAPALTAATTVPAPTNIHPPGPGPTTAIPTVASRLTPPADA